MMATNSLMKAALRCRDTRRYLSCLAASPSSTLGRNQCGAIAVRKSQQLPHAPSSPSNSKLSFSSYNSYHVSQLQSCKNGVMQSKRSFSAAVSSSTSTISCIENTPLDGPKGAKLLQGLDIHTVPAEYDGHPLAVYTVENDDNDETQHNERIPVLLLHGRTWSSVPVYHLVGDSNKNNPDNASEGGGENRSLIQALYNTQNIQPYAMDFRGFGGTPKDESGFNEPLKCVSDVISVLDWIQDKHNNNDEGSGDIVQPTLLGWSHGALIAQITAQRHPEALSKLILYGSTYNPNVKYSIPPPENPHKGQTDHEDFPLHAMTSRNEYDGAMEDFTNASGNEARIFPPISARLFAEAALVSDPMKVQWWNLHQLNECHPSLVTVPTMVIAGDQDPYAPVQTQAELFTNLERGVDRSWSIIANADHAVHLSDERDRLVENINNFLQTH